MDFPGILCFQDDFRFTFFLQLYLFAEKLEVKSRYRAFTNSQGQKISAMSHHGNSCRYLWSVSCAKHLFKRAIVPKSLMVVLLNIFLQCSCCDWGLTFPILLFDWPQGGLEKFEHAEYEILDKHIKDKPIIHSAVKKQTNLVDSSKWKNFTGVELYFKKMVYCFNLIVDTAMFSKIRKFSFLSSIASFASCSI